MINYNGFPKNWILYATASPGPQTSTYTYWNTGAPGFKFSYLLSFLKSKYVGKPIPTFL